MALFNSFESSAGLIDWSFLILTLIREIKCLSGQLNSFMCFSAKNFWSSLLIYLVN